MAHDFSAFRQLDHAEFQRIAQFSGRYINFQCFRNITSSATKFEVMVNNVQDAFCFDTWGYFLVGEVYLVREQSVLFSDQRA